MVLCLLQLICNTYNYLNENETGSLNLKNYNNLSIIMFQHFYRKYVTVKENASVELVFVTRRQAIGEKHVKIVL